MSIQALPIRQGHKLSGAKLLCLFPAEVPLTIMEFLIFQQKMSKTNDDPARHGEH